jgi:hypothetical protein
MKAGRVWLIVAVAAVLVADSAVLLSARGNRRSTSSAMELTERELRLAETQGDSTVVFLELLWTTDPAKPHRSRSAEFLDREKLLELGFKCELPPNSADARRYYGSQSPRIAWLVLEYRSGNTNTGKDAVRGSALVPVDAARDAGALRARSEERGRYLVVRGVIHARLIDHADDTQKPLPAPEVRGWIEMLLPPRIYVPRPHNKLLLSLPSLPATPHQFEPRFAATICWGKNGEPWIKNVRLMPQELTTATAETQAGSSMPNAAFSAGLPSQ